jgi:hypothetical protein
MSRHIPRRTLLIVLVLQISALCLSAAEADVYRWVPMPRSTLPTELTDGAAAREQIVTLNGTRIKVHYWQPRAAMTDIRNAVRRTVVLEYAAWRQAKRKDPGFDADRSAYWALPRVVLNPNSLALVRFGSDGQHVGAAPIQISDVTLVLPAGDSTAAAATVLEFEMPTRSAMSLLSIRATADAPGRDHEQAGRPAGSTRVFSIEQVQGGVRQFTASYVTPLSPIEAVESLAANLSRQGFKIVLRSVQSGEARIELRDRITELTLFGLASSTPGVQGEVIVSATDSAIK